MALWSISKKNSRCLTTVPSGEITMSISIVSRRPAMLQGTRLPKWIPGCWCMEEKCEHPLSCDMGSHMWIKMNIFGMRVHGFTLWHFEELGQNVNGKFDGRAKLKDFPQGTKFGITSARGIKEDAYNRNAPWHGTGIVTRGKWHWRKIFRWTVIPFHKLSIHHLCPDNSNYIPAWPPGFF